MNNKTDYLDILWFLIYVIFCVVAILVIGSILIETVSELFLNIVEVLQ